MKIVERIFNPARHPDEVGNRRLPQRIARYFAYDFPITHDPHTENFTHTN